jgi:hypothetical protein
MRVTLQIIGIINFTIYGIFHTLALSPIVEAHKLKIKQCTIHHNSTYIIQLTF